MKKHRKEEEFLEQARKIPNISLACEKTGLSRNTIYRWRKEDPEFAKRLDEALATGVESVNDLAESKLIAHLNNGNLRVLARQQQEEVRSPEAEELLGRHLQAR